MLSWIAVEGVVDARIAATHRALDDDDGLGLVHVEDGHPVDRGSRIGSCYRVGHVVGSDDQGHVERGNSGLMSSISLSCGYGTLASASSTFM